MIYVQSDKDRKLPHHFDAACALYGAQESCQDFRLTTFEEVESGKFDNLLKTNLFVGSQEFMDEVFKRANRKPEALPNSDRHYVTQTLKEVRNRVNNNEKLFVKPFQRKFFNGTVVDKYSLSYLNEYSDGLHVMVYEVIPNIFSEWRIYIHNHKIVESKNYGSDFKISPDYAFIEERIQHFKPTMPVAYTMDVGVTKMNNVIIEFNDFYAIGNYGIDNQLYVMMLKDRYFEIIRTCQKD